MLNYKALEHSDNFGAEVICWVEVTGVPERFCRGSQKNRRDNYIGDGFGVCVQYDRGDEEYFAVEDEPGCNLYYIDNKGDKHWFPYKVNEQEMQLLSQNVEPEIEQEIGRVR